MSIKQAILPLAALCLAACGQSVDERFAQACDEMRAEGGEVAESSADACRYRDYASPQQKEVFVQLWEERQLAKARFESVTK